MSGDRARRIVVAALATVAVGCVLAGLRPADARSASASGPRAPALGTPLWSARRIPQPLVDAVGTVTLQARLAELTAGTDACFVVDVPGVGVVARGDESRPLTPASTQKVLTAAGALAILGPDSTFETRVVAPAAPVDGTVDRVWLVGGGDPLLSTPTGAAALQAKPEYHGLPVTSLARLADEIAAAGVRSIPGGVLGDDSAYDTPRALPVWSSADLTSGEVGPLGALEVDDGADPAATGAPLADPALGAAGALTELLRARGVAVGEPGRGIAPSDATPVATLASPPLRDVVAEMLSASDNDTAEALVLAAGRAAGGHGDTTAGIAAIRSKLTTLGVDLTGVTQVDGSGLSHDNRMTCRALAQTLALGRGPALHALVDGLSIAGTRGTLLADFVDSPLAGHLHAKTGTLSGVAGLVGLVDTGRAPDFATLFNGSFTRGGGAERTNGVASAAAAFPQAPAAEQLVPAPQPPRRAG